MKDTEKKEMYKKKIIDIVKDIENDKYIEFIYNLLISFKKKWGV